MRGQSNFKNQKPSGRRSQNNNNQSHNRPKTTPEERSNAWLLAIRTAGQVAAVARDEDQLLAAAAHLEQLRHALEKRRQYWYQVPRNMPPLARSNNNGPTLSVDPEAGDVIFSHGPTPAVVVARAMMASANTTTTNNNTTSNRFAAFGDPDDDDNDDHDDDHDDSNNSDNDATADDKEGTENEHHHNKTHGTPLMIMRRLLIRVLTTLSELQAQLASVRHRRVRQHNDHQGDASNASNNNNNNNRVINWEQGADDYARAFEYLNVALEIADGEYTRLFVLDIDVIVSNNSQDAAMMTALQHLNINNDNNNNTTTATNTENNNSLLLMQQLADDAHVVLIALGHFTNAQQKYLAAAQRRREYLQRKLTPQWESRDEIKQKLGPERWENNPHPKMDYARQRQADEHELWALEESMDRLQSLNLDQVYRKSEQIYQVARNRSGIDGASSNNNDARGSPPAKNRYNGIRPDYGNARVSFQDYPDPTEYGWTFTGSHSESVVEFFEKQVPNDRNNNNNNNTQNTVLVKLDFYYTTGTVKTSMDHPTKGPNQLFGNKVTPDQYRQILENPRAHTDVRYRTRQAKSNTVGRGGGRGGGSGGRGRGRSGGFGRGGGGGRGGRR